MTIQDANTRLLFQLYHMYGDSEAANIADLVMEKITGWKRIDRVINKEVKLSQEMEILLEKYISELSDLKPVQYVLNESWFYGMKFFVNENVLIPRPETEELVEWVILHVQGLQKRSPRILDIGTGSGCIPVTLKKKLNDAIVYACDVSENALEVARENAKLHETEIRFIQADIFDREQLKLLPSFDIIVSNPPYIPYEEKTTLEENVLRHEPHLALFVPDNDPLIFYRAIAEFGKEKLLPGGNIFVEIHEELSHRTAELFLSKGFTDAEIKKDMQRTDRMIKTGISVA